MRTLLTALFITLATQTSAFDINLDEVEVRRLNAEYLVDDLSVGVKAVVNNWAFCTKDNELFINRVAPIEEPERWRTTYEITLLPTGKIDAVLVPAEDSSGNSLSFPSTSSCDEEIQILGFYPVNTIEGVDNLAEFISVALGKGYTIGNKTAAKELRQIVQPKDTYAEIFTDVYEDKIKSAISHCLVTSTVSSYGIPEDAQMIVGANFNRDGKVKASSLSLIHHSINSDTRANVLFQGIRRAILRCQGAGYLLPSENYDSWKSMTISFSKSDLFKD